MWMNVYLNTPRTVRLAMADECMHRQVLSTLRAHLVMGHNPPRAVLWQHLR
jgi:hypothetical protein